MAIPTILIAQAGAPVTGAGVSNDGLATGVLVTLSDPANGTGSYTWELVTPPGSVATLSSVNAASPTFTPDIVGTYLVYLTFDSDLSFTLDADGQKVSTQGGCGVKHRNGTRPLGVGETFQFHASEGYANTFHPYFGIMDSVQQVAGSPFGTIFYSDANGDIQRLVPGVSGQVLSTNGIGAAPSWIAAGGGGGGGGGGNTLDGAYDQGGGGAGGTITADFGAVAINNLNADNSNTLELTRTNEVPNGSALRVLDGDIRLDAGDIHTVNAFLGNGLVTAPSLAFDASSSLGLYRVDANTLGIAGGSANRMTFGSVYNDSYKTLRPDSTGARSLGTSSRKWNTGHINNINAGDGTTISPSYRFSSDTSLGMYKNISGELSFASGFTDMLNMSNTQITSHKNIVPSSPDVYTLGEHTTPWSLAYISRGVVMKERSTSPASSTSQYGQFWIRNDSPCTPMFTDDTGTDYVLNSSGGGGGGNTLDQAYDQGGGGLGRAIIADSGAVSISNAVADATNALELDRTAAIGNGSALSILNGNLLLSNGVAMLDDGSVGSPSISYHSDTNTGIYWPATNELAISTGGIQALKLDGNQDAIFAGRAILPDGNLASPALTFGSNTQLGLFKASSDRVMFAANGNWLMSMEVFWNVSYRDFVPGVNDARELGDATRQWTIAHIARGVRLKERPAAPLGSSALYGQFWIRNDTPNTPMFTNGTGNNSRLDNEGRTLDAVYCGSAHTAGSTLYPARDGTFSAGSGKGWHVMARGGSLTELVSWVYGDVTSGTYDFKVERSTDGGDTWSDFWGTSAAPIHTLDTSAAENKVTTAAKFSNTFLAGDYLRIVIITSAGIAGPTEVWGQIGVEY